MLSRQCSFPRKQAATCGMFQFETTGDAKRKKHLQFTLCAINHFYYDFNIMYNFAID